MRYFNFAISSLLLLSIPTMSVYPQIADIQNMQKVSSDAESQQNDALLGYDEVLNFIEDVESVDLKDAADFADVNQVKNLLANVAEAGMLPTDSYESQIELAYDIQQLLEDDEPFQHAYYPHVGSDYVLIPALLWQKDIIYCSWFSKKWKQIKHFCKKHKKALIIGAGVLVAATGLALAIMAATAPAAALAEAATAGAAAVGSAGYDKKVDSRVMDNVSEAQDVSAVPKENPIIPVVKDVVSQADLPPISEDSEKEEFNKFKEAVRDTVSIIAHETVDLAQEILAQVPSNLGLAGIALDSTKLEEIHEEKVDAIHETIDQLLSTDLAKDYTPEGKEAIREGSYLPEIPTLAFLGPAGVEGECLSAVKSSINELANIVENLAPKTELVAEGVGGLMTNEARVLSAEEKVAFAFSEESRVASSGIAHNTTGINHLSTPVRKIFSDTDRVLSAGKVADKGGLTKAGRGLMKHGYRNITIFPKPVGNPTQINKHGQKVLESIVNHPERVFHERVHPKLGNIVDITVPGKGGVRFTANGEMIGFLEP